MYRLTRDLYLQKSKEPGQLPRHLGNKTECALLQFAGELGEDYEAIRKANTEESFFKVYTFNSKRKCMATVLKTETGFRIFVIRGKDVVIWVQDSALGFQKCGFWAHNQNRLSLKETIQYSCLTF